MNKPFFSPIALSPEHDECTAPAAPSMADLVTQELYSVPQPTAGHAIAIRFAPIRLDLAVQLFSCLRAEALPAEEFATAVLGLSEQLGNPAAERDTRSGKVATVALQLEGQGKASEAEALLRQNVNGLRGRVGRYDPQTLRAQTELAQVLHHEGKLTEARRLYLHTIEAQREVLGTHHGDTITTLAHLANLLVSTGDLEHAEPLIEETILVRRRLFGNAHGDTLASFAQLAMLRHAQGRLSEAEDLLQHVFSVQNQSLGARHPQTLKTQASLGQVLQEVGRLAEAETVHRAVLALRTEVLGQSHVDTLASAHALGACLIAQGHHDAVLPMLQRTQSVATRSLCRYHIFLADVQAQIGCCHAALRQFKQAEKELTQAYAQMRRSRGFLHKSTQDVLRALIDLYSAWGKPDKAASYRAAHATCS